MMSTTKQNIPQHILEWAQRASANNRRMMEDEEYRKKIEAELHYTVDSPAVQKLRAELKALRDQREQQEGAADGDA